MSKNAQQCVKVDVDVVNDDTRVGDSQVSDVSVLASCQSLHTLNLGNTLLSDVSALASCQALHTL
jgi:Leucine-rich repeat (LRR) protein